MKFNNKTIRVAVKEWLYDEIKAESKYGHISDWDTSNVTDMSSLFLNAESFNQPIDNWDVSNVNNMVSMFENCKCFNQPIGKWNIEIFHIDENEEDIDVLCLSKMFYNAESFNQPLDEWPKFPKNSKGANIFFGAHKEMISKYGINGENLDININNADSVEIDVLQLRKSFYYLDDEGKEDHFDALGIGVYIGLENKYLSDNGYTEEEVIEEGYDKIVIVCNRDSDIYLLVIDLPNILDSEAYDQEWIDSLPLNEKPFKSIQEAHDFIKNLNTISFKEVNKEEDGYIYID